MHLKEAAAVGGARILSNGYLGVHSVQMVVMFSTCLKALSRGLVHPGKWGRMDFGRGGGVGLTFLVYTSYRAPT